MQVVTTCWRTQRQRLLGNRPVLLSLWLKAKEWFWGLGISANIGYAEEDSLNHFDGLLDLPLIDSGESDISKSPGIC